MRGPLCPDCGRPTVILVFLIMCAYCRYAAKEWEFMARQQRATERDAVEAKRKDSG